MLKNNSGFSLIELMVVVAIIGILSAVAVPQFQKFQRKAKQSEARANLGGIYTAQKVFLAEHGTYYRNLIATGFEPEGTLQYRTGFNTGGSVTAPAGYTAAHLLPTVYHETFSICGYNYADGYSTNCTHVNGTLTGAYPGTSWVPTSTTFLVGARGNIGGAAQDIWTMNHRKELLNTSNGAL